MRLRAECTGHLRRGIRENRHCVSVCLPICVKAKETDVVLNASLIIITTYKRLEAHKDS